MKSVRDRTLLVRYYLKDEDKKDICRELGLTELSFNVILFRGSQPLPRIASKAWIERRGPVLLGNPGVDRNAALLELEVTESRDAERYVAGTLSAEEAACFEEAMIAHPELVGT